MFSITETISQSDNKLTTYGIKSESFVYDDISPDFEKIKALCELCNLLELDECHLADVIDDFLSDLDI